MTYKENDSQSHVEAYEPHNNLKYGVYALRAEYHITVIKSLLAVCAFLGAIALVTRLAPASRKPVEIETVNLQDVIYTMSVDVPETTPEAPASQAEPDPSPAQRSDNAPIVISDNEPEVEPPATSTTQSNQLTNTAKEPGGNGQSNSTGTGTTAATGNSAAVSSPYMVDVMPEFEGGIIRLRKFIALNVRYPEPAREMGKEGTVHVQFVVDTEGNISQITLLNHVGSGLDEEALRVIGLLPKFKSPGMSKGVPVSVYYTIPIKFKIQ
jgi:periplasmic protein TonB